VIPTADEHDAIVDAVRKVLGKDGPVTGFIAIATRKENDEEQFLREAVEAARSGERLILCLPRVSLKDFREMVRKAEVKCRRMSIEAMFSDQEGVIAWLEM